MKVQLREVSAFDRTQLSADVRVFVPLFVMMKSIDVEDHDRVLGDKIAVVHKVLF